MTSAAAHDPVATAPADAPASSTAALAPLLAVCGLCGGAGASTLSYLIAGRAAQRLDGPVLVADTGGPTAGLAVATGVATRLSLPEAAEQAARGVPVERIWATTRPHRGGGRPLRTIAADPRVGAGVGGAPGVLRALLTGLRSHGEIRLAVIDCGTLQRGPDRLVLRQASHVAWALPASADAIVRAQRMLRAVPALPAARESIVGRGSSLNGPAATLGELTGLAIHRRAPLVLIPELERGPLRLAAALDTAAAGLDAILDRLAR